MAQKTRKPELDLEVDGQAYVWRVQRQPVWSTDAASWRGMAIAVSALLVAQAITSAIAAGWDPLSRGKTVAFLVDEKGG